MKNFLFVFFAVLGLGLLCNLGLPWWAIVPIGLLVGWLLKPTAGFQAGFLAGFLLWGVLALVLDHANGGLLSARIGQLFQGVGNWVLIFITGLIGGLLSGFSVLAGSWGRDLIFPPFDKSPYAKRRRRR